MVKYIKTKDGKFAGSIGDGKTKAPVKPLKPPRGVRLAPKPVAIGRADLTEMYDRFMDLTREREAAARDGLQDAIRGKFPTATTFVVEEEDTSDVLNGHRTSMIPVQILDDNGSVLWEQPAHRRENTEFEQHMFDFSQVLTPGRWEPLTTDEGIGRRYTFTV